MKSFKKFIFITLVPIILIVVGTIINSKSFDDLRHFHINISVFSFFSIISFCYVYIYENLMVKKGKVTRNLAYSILSVFVLTLIFSTLIGYLLMDDFNFKISLFQSTLMVCLFLLVLVVFELYKKTIQEEIFIVNEKPFYYIKLLLKVFGILSFFLLIFIFIPLVDKVSFEKGVEIVAKILLFNLQTTLLSFLSLSILYKIKHLRKKIILGVISASIISSLGNLYLNEVLQNSFFLGFIVHFLFCLFCCSMIVLSLIYRNKIQKLSLSFSKKETEYLQLKNQINPHFLFNNLNTLIAFIETNPQKAIAFGHHLSNVYRHYLKNDEHDFVLLKNEIQFISEYLAIFKAKFENGFIFEIENEASQEQYILSLSLQELVDNIFKHNILDVENPVIIKISIHQNELIISNTNVRKEAVHSTKKGLKNIHKRYNLLTKKQITITDNATFFEVKIPILHLTK
ncbi:sensor histidine kinase [Flavobacterium soli]|uniref:sensor histidine kinase n=1 Tax=Flavobacterium soli TaxID=344881 RepID=UPI00041F640E|nr:histidine kinase [Flavobacterium soli]